jgi:excinuclease ABC subunit C
MIDLKNIPESPGCYLFMDKEGRIIYIGKAKNLKKRVSSYFQKKSFDTKTEILIGKIKDVSFIATNNEVEALILENNLIKKNTPKYNINLKDSKRYAYIELTREKFPRLVIARKRVSSGKYFGPFVSGTDRNYVRELIIKTFKIRTCKKFPKKPCLRYHINLCSAPCVGLITETNYDSDVRSAVMVLRGHNSELISELKNKMNDSSEKKDYEKAIARRNQIQAVKWLSEKQTMERQKKYDEDIINFIVKESRVYLILFNLYKGMLENKQEFDFLFNENFFEEFLVQYYSDNPVPKELILPKLVDESIGHFLKERRKNNVIITVPKIGEKKNLLELVGKNIELTFFGDMTKLDDLRAKLKLNENPNVIECFDISHLSGTSTVGSMVQFRNAKPDKSNYRRFKIKTVSGIDDFAAISEVVSRRYKRLILEKKELPKLIIIDGGKGQLSAALDELNKLNLKIPIISIAKKMEEIFVPGLSFSIRLDRKSKALLLIQEMRDEAHRFAIKYNRLLRKKEIK